METVNINAHDLKHKIRGIMSALDGEENEAVKQELRRVTDSISGWDALYHTGNKPLDVVLSEKAQQCRQREIELSVVADGAALDFMDEFDIYSLLSNALSNAIEAAGKLDKSEERLIIFNLTQRNGFALLKL